MLRFLHSKDSPAGYPYRKNVNGDQRHRAGARIVTRSEYQLIAKLVRRSRLALARKSGRPGH
jgi:hypothetical protein